MLRERLKPNGFSPLASPTPRTQPSLPQLPPRTSHKAFEGLSSVAGVENPSHRLPDTLHEPFERPSSRPRAHPQLHADAGGRGHLRSVMFTGAWRFFRISRQVDIRNDAMGGRRRARPPAQNCDGHRSVKAGHCDRHRDGVLHHPSSTNCGRLHQWASDHVIIARKLTTVTADPTNSQRSTASMTRLSPD